MKKIESYSEFSAAVTRCFGRGSVTNCFLDRRTVESEIEAGTLYSIESDGGVFFFRERDGFRIMNFFLSSSDTQLISFPDNTVCEIPFREHDEGIKATVARFIDLGFVHRFTRVRLTKRSNAEEHYNGNISTATDKDIPEALGLIKKAFDSRTGCIPTDAAFARDVRDGHVLVYRDGAIVGLVHWNEDGKTSDIRHVAVDERCRGQGIASALVGVYSTRKSGRYRVWAREDYTSARRVYEKNGYTPDGMKSAVLYFESEKGE